MSLPFVLCVETMIVSVALVIGTAVRMRLEGVSWCRLCLAPLMTILLFVVWPVALVLRARFRAAARVVRLYPQLVGVVARRFLRHEGEAGAMPKMLRSVRECRIGLEELLVAADEL